jgi:hypothetical protein
MAELAVENEIVALGSNIDSRLLAEQDKGEDIAVLCAVLAMRPGGNDCAIQRTFALLTAKNLTGSMPYVIVLPTKGTRWKTTGGSLGFLKRSCFSTLATMMEAPKATTLRATKSHERSLARKGSSRVDRIPISAVERGQWWNCGW